MNMTVNGNKDQSGFALIAVLFSLVILVLLFGSAQKNFISHATFLGAQYNNEAGDVLDQNLIAIIQLYSTNPDITSIEIGGQTMSISFQDVGGLVDLNTASPDLLNLLLTNIDVEDVLAALTKYQNWRRQGYKLQRISDFVRVTGLPYSVTADLAPFTTVKSGRKGIDPDSAPLALLEVLTGATGSEEYLAELIPETLRSPASNVNYTVSLIGSDGTIISKVTAHIPANQNDIQILDITR